MGGNLVLKLAGEWGREAPPQLRAVAAVCPSMNLAASADALHLPANRLYEYYFMWQLRRRLRVKARLFPQVFDTSRMRGVTTLRDFDDKVTAHYCGFEGASDYYQRSAAANVVDRIAVPTLNSSRGQRSLYPHSSGDAAEDSFQSQHYFRRNRGWWPLLVSRRSRWRRWTLGGAAGRGIPAWLLSAWGQPLAVRWSASRLLSYTISFSNETGRENRIGNGSGPFAGALCLRRASIATEANQLRQRLCWRSRPQHYRATQ